jgi:predicted GNAT family acetyltransferase
VPLPVVQEARWATGPVSVQEAGWATGPVCVQEAGWATGPVCVQEAGWATGPVCVQEAGWATGPVCVQEAGWATGPVCMRMENLAPTEARSPPVLSAASRYTEWIKIYGVAGACSMDFDTVCEQSLKGRPSRPRCICPCTRREGV